MGAVHDPGVTRGHDLAVVIPTQGLRPTLRPCLQRLAAQTDRAFTTVLVADATADLGVVRAAAQDADGLEVVVLQADRPGASSARNAGWRAAGAYVVVFLDDDVLADPGLVAAHRAVHDADASPSTGALGTMRWAEHLPVTPFMRFIEDGLQFDYEAIGATRETGWWHLYTCNVSLKRAALEAVGGLDADGFPFGYEDLDLGRRIDDAIGLRLVVAPEAGAEHDHAMTLEQWRTRIRRIAWSERRFVTRFPDVAPHFHDRLARVRDEPPMRDVHARLAPHVPHAVPVLGPYLHHHAGRWYAQQLVEPFFAAWEEAAAEADPGPPPAPAGSPA